jgi:hypothetical protein
VLGDVTGRLGAGEAEDGLGLGLAGGLDGLALEAEPDGVALGVAAGLPQPAKPPRPTSPMSSAAATVRARRMIPIEVSDLDNTANSSLSLPVLGCCRAAPSLTNQHAVAFP